MGVISTLGDIVFEVSSERVRTFANMTHTANSRWAEHEVARGKPRAEFLGPGTNEIELIIRLSSQHGVDPRKEMEKIGTMLLQGRHALLMLGGRPIGNGEWRVETSETNMIWVNGRGEVEFAEMTVTLREYF